jgi:hypothetical protein
MRCRWLLLSMLLISVVGCASQSGPQTESIRLPNCTIGVFGRYPNVNCNTGGMSIPVGR